MFKDMTLPTSRYNQQYRIRFCNTSQTSLIRATQSALWETVFCVVSFWRRLWEIFILAILWNSVISVIVGAFVASLPHFPIVSLHTPRARLHGSHYVALTHWTLWLQCLTRRKKIILKWHDFKEVNSETAMTKNSQVKEQTHQYVFCSICPSCCLSAKQL